MIAAVEFFCIHNILRARRSGAVLDESTVRMIHNPALGRVIFKFLILLRSLLLSIRPIRDASDRLDQPLHYRSIVLLLTIFSSIPCTTCDDVSKRGTVGSPRNDRDDSSLLHDSIRLSFHHINCT
jgi:hypothetical protein